MKKKNNNGLAVLGLAVLLVVGLTAGWYLISPLFINVSVDEEFPAPVLSEATATVVEEAAVIVEATAEMEKAQETQPAPVEEPMPTAEPEGMVILAQGEIYDVAHHGMGSATIYQLEDGSRILRLEDFEVLNGPELHVYFTSEATVADRAGTGLANGYDLGNLKGNIGNQNYEIPADLDLSVFNSVVIWCVPFQVPFNAAPLTTP